MRNIVVKLLIGLSWIYSLGHILFGFPNDTFIMRAVTGVMSMIFSYSLLLFLLKVFDNKKIDTHE